MTLQRWTDAEDGALRTRYAHEPTRVIAADLGRTVHAVRYRAQLLGLRATRTGTHHHRTRWTGAIVERARDLHEHTDWPADRIAAELGVPRDTIHDWIHYRTRIGPECYRTLRRRESNQEGA